MAVVLVVGIGDVSPSTFAEQLTQQSYAEGATWRIATKYYETDVRVNTSVLRDASADSLANADCEGLILYAHERDADAVTAARTWFMTRRNDPAVSLLVLDVGSEPTEPSWLEEQTVWCAANGFELIRVSATDADGDGWLAQDEGHGLKRVREALEAHVWPGCTLKKRTFSSQEPSSATVEREGPTAEDVGSEDDADFEKLLAEMTHARERLKRLPDQQRREGAANLAMRLAKYFADE